MSYTTYILHTFTSQKQMSDIIAILGRIGDCGGKRAFSAEKSEHKVAGKPVYNLKWNAEHYVRHVQKLAQKEGRTPTSPTTDLLDSRALTLQGMVRGITYMQGGTK